eukprot:3603038-Lingulodinium_polyedra.AAC.1
MAVRPPALQTRRAAMTVWAAKSVPGWLPIAICAGRRVAPTSGAAKLRRRPCQALPRIAARTISRKSAGLEA